MVLERGAGIDQSSAEWNTRQLRADQYGMPSEAQAVFRASLHNKIGYVRNWMRENGGTTGVALNGLVFLDRQLAPPFPLSNGADERNALHENGHYPIGFIAGFLVKDVVSPLILSRSIKRKVLGFGIGLGGEALTYVVSREIFPSSGRDPKELAIQTTGSYVAGLGVGLGLGVARTIKRRWDMNRHPKT